MISSPAFPPPPRPPSTAPAILANPGLGGNGVILGSVDPRPAAGSLAFTNPNKVQMGDPFFDAVTYTGAFGNDELGLQVVQPLAVGPHEAPAPRAARHCQPPGNPRQPGQDLPPGLL